VKKQPIGKWYFWIILSVLIKGIIFLLLSAELGAKNDRFIGVIEGDVGGDSNSYILPVENFLSNGLYEPDYRMPGYSIFYFLLRLLFNVYTSQNGMIVIQVLLSAISVYVLALISYRIFRSARIFNLVYFTFLISTYAHIFDLYLLTESLTTSFSIFAVYFFVKGLQEKKNADIFACGIWTTWIIFLRPVYAPYLLFFAILIILFLLKAKINFQRIVLFLTLLCLPFIIVDSLWILRNYNRYSRFQPLMSSVYYPNAEVYYTELVNFLQSWGGNYISWDPNAEIRILGLENSPAASKVSSNRISIPDNIYTKEFNKDSLRLVKSLVYGIENKLIGEDSLPLAKRALVEKLKRYTQSVKSEHPFTYYVIAPLKYFKLFLIHSGTYNLMHKPWPDLNLIKKVIKLLYSAQYLFIILTGSAGIVLLLLKRYNRLEIILPLFCLYSVIIFPWVFRFPEMRYFVPAFPFMVICSMYVTNKFLNRLIPEHPITINPTA
jgi:hypothetical protein